VIERKKERWTGKDSKGVYCYQVSEAEIEREKERETNMLLLSIKRERKDEKAKGRPGPAGRFFLRSEVNFST